MNQVTERKRQRREYLQKKSKGTVLATTSLILVTIPILMALTAVSIYIGVGYRGAYVGLFERVPDCDDVTPIFFAGFLLLLAGVAAGMLRSAVRMNKKGHNLLSIPYVPPVIPSTLPAEEILVRAADELPVAQSEILLRAAGGQETPKEKLLRVTPE